MPSRATLLQGPVVAWALYDWANSAFATTVMVAFFPLFFKQYWSVQQSATVSTFWLGAVNGGADLVLAGCAPWLGALADRRGARKRLLFLFTALGSLATGLLSLVGAGQWPWAAALFALATIGAGGSYVFYDSLLVDVAPRERLDSVSGLGYALGYLGGGVLFAINVWMTRAPQSFGLSDAATAVRVSFVTVAAWWLLFSIPIFTRVREHRPESSLGAAAPSGGFVELTQSLRQVFRHRLALRFLVAYWLYIDGVNTMQKMAVDYGLAIGLPSSSLILAILMIQFVGFPAALAFGWAGERVGPRAGIFVGLGVFAGVTVYATRMTSAGEFYFLAAAIACVQGGVQSLSRSYYARLVPAEQSGAFFGVYNMMSKFAAVLGPFLMGITALSTGDSRVGVFSVLVLFVAGGVVLAFCRAPR